MQGFPAIHELNQWRVQSHKDAHDQNQPFDKRLSGWLGHKKLSALSLPVNAAAVGIGTAVTTTCAFTLGSLKVAIFAGTLGNVKPDFPTGVIWFGERTLHSLGHLFVNLYEVSYDTADLAYQAINKAYQGAKWVAQALKIDHIVIPLLIKAKDYCLKKLSFIFERIGKGLDQSWKDECSIVNNKWETIPIVEQLNSATRNVSFSKETDRSLNKWISHKVLSIFNIPANVAVGIIATAVSSVTWPIFVAKSLLFAATNLSIPIPTTSLYSSKVAVTSFGNALINGGDNVADMAIGIYKTAEALRITKVVATLGEVLAYIPRAIFT